MDWPADKITKRPVAERQRRRREKTTAKRAISDGSIADCGTAATDPAGNRKLDKARSRERIDGAVALVMAIGLHAREPAPDDSPSVYESDGFFI